MRNKAKVKNKKAKVKNKFLPFYIVCLFLGISINIFAQTGTDFLLFADKIRNGTVEEKRDILFQIRNIKTEQASRLAIPTLNDSSEIVRATATNSVIFLPSDEAVRLLLPLLQDKSILVRRETVYALGKTRNPQATNSLLQILQNDKEFEVKTAAVIALGEIGDVSAVDNLTEILQRKPKEKENFLRRSVARSIGQIAHFQQFQEYPKTFFDKFYYLDFQESIQPQFESLTKTLSVFQKSNEVLISILQNSKESDDTKRESAFALGEIADESSIQILQQNSSSEDIYLAEISQNSLTKIQKFIEFQNKLTN
jgi:HEAT repeat protein